MKVTDIKTFTVDCFRTNWVFVKVYTDEGITGVGEATLEYKEKSLVGAVEHIFFPVAPQADGGIFASDLIHKIQHLPERGDFFPGEFRREAAARIQLPDLGKGHVPQIAIHTAGAFRVAVVHQNGNLVL